MVVVVAVRWVAWVAEMSTARCVVWAAATILKVQSQKTCWAQRGTGCWKWRRGLLG